MTIDRREFAALVLGSLTTALGALRANAQSTAPVRVNGDRLNGHLAALSQFGTNPQGGVSRVAYSQADIDARAAVAGWMRDASLDVEIRPGGGTSSAVAPGERPRRSPSSSGRTSIRYRKAATTTATWARWRRLRSRRRSQSAR